MQSRTALSCGVESNECRHSFYILGKSKVEETRIKTCRDRNRVRLLRGFHRLCNMEEGEEEQRKRNREEEEEAERKKKKQRGRSREEEEERRRTKEQEDETERRRKKKLEPSNAPYLV